MGGGGGFLGLGGGGGGASFNFPQPPKPEPIDYEAMYGAARKYGKLMLGDQVEATLGLYPQMTNLQFGTADEMARRLDNDYFRRARGVISDELDTASAPNQIEAELQRQAQEELALGRSLSPEQERAAQQSARAAFAARGLGTSMGGSAAEILNRDAAATQREAERRAAASQANNMMMGNVMSRRGMMADNLYAGAGNLLAVDPQNRALGIGLQSAQNQQGMMMNQIGSAFAGANQMAGNAASFNFNAQESRNNAAMNNWASMRAANMQAGAANNSATMGMIGSGVGAAAGLAVVGIAI